MKETPMQVTEACSMQVGSSMVELKKGEIVIVLEEAVSESDKTVIMCRIATRGGLIGWVRKDKLKRVRLMKPEWFMSFWDSDGRDKQ